MTMPLPCRLAFSDLAYARLTTICQVIGLAALLVPLLILFGIKNGVIADRTEALLRNPEDLRINIGGQNLYPQGFIEDMRNHPDVRFIGPHPTSLAVLADFAVPVNGGAVAPRVTLLSTGADDPYLDQIETVPAPGEVVLSATLAGQLDGIEPGDTVEVLLNPREGAPLGAFMTLEITDVLAAGVWGRSGALMASEDVFLIQDWTHGNFSDENLDLLRDTYVLPEEYPLIRLYARDVDGAFRLVEDLAARGLPSGSSLEKARELVGLRDALDAGFRTVAIVGLVGVTATFSASLWAGINRNRRPISLLRLGGLGRRASMLLPITQAAVIGLVGWLASILLYAALTRVVDFYLADVFAVDDSLARLSITEFAMSGAATLLVSAVAAVGAALTITAITPEEGFLDAK